MNYKKIGLIVAVIALANAPICALGDWTQLSPNPNDGTINISAGIGNEKFNSLNFVNNGVINNNWILANLWGDTGKGVLFNFGTINNYYRLSNDDSSTFYNESGGTLNNYYELTNWYLMYNFEGGILNNESGGSFLNKLTLANYGTLNNKSAATLDTSTLDNYGTLTNSGTVINRKALNNVGILNNNLHGTLNNISTTTLTNSGTLNNNSGATLANSGTLNNKSGATLANSGVLNNNHGATLNNNGTLNNSGQLNNYATLKNDLGSTLNNYVYLINYSGAILNNSGVLNNNSLLSIYANATLNNYGVLNTYEKEFGVVTDFGGTLNNFGIINNYESAQFLSNGTLNNKSGATLNNEGYLIVNGLDNSGTLNNKSGSQLWVNYLGNTLTNSGTLTNYAGGQIIVYDPSQTLNNNLGATLNNNSGATLKNGGTVINKGTIINDGQITGFGTGFDSYPGTYIQTAGLTKNMGSMSQSSIQINGGILSGTGIITGNVTIGGGGAIQPGDDPGMLTINGNFSNNGRLLIDIASASSYSVLKISGNATFNSGSIIELDFLNGYIPAAGRSWDFLSAQSVAGLDNVGFMFGGLASGLCDDFTYSNNSGVLHLMFLNDGPGVHITPLTGTEVPVPPSIVLLGSGLLGLLGARRRKRWLK